MAQVSIVKKALVLAIVAVAISAVTVSAQASAPSPDFVARAAFSLPASGMMIGTSLVLPFVALFRN
ncbi:hypothetical protein HanXRQr2_Chr08g0335641 [Helianthus annuus]|uniref:Uncharacterized protein n=1 Tax=Helianthus annuus TaxID=4232 RepID=A0A9K3IF68_HELAN|nr:hypothetical protein HanXRQr2_Chr08g0335641 [Helianthus annuus]KAJ0901348.1 hypothetical protein HanPSC8_Chr08g0324281 [Helianthus annuus]